MRRRRKNRRGKRCGEKIASLHISLVNDSLVHRSEEFVLDVGRIRYELKHENNDHAALGVHLIFRAVCPTPPECANTRQQTRAIAVDGFESVSEAQSSGRMQRAGLVCGHQLDSARSQNANSVECATSADHFEEVGVVARRRSESRAARETLARSID